MHANSNAVPILGVRSARKAAVLVQASQTRDHNLSIQVTHPTWQSFCGEFSEQSLYIECSFSFVTNSQQISNLAHTWQCSTKLGALDIVGHERCPKSDLKEADTEAVHVVAHVVDFFGRLSLSCGMSIQVLMPYFVACHIRPACGGPKALEPYKVGRAAICGKYGLRTYVLVHEGGTVEEYDRASHTFGGRQPERE
jgi:hypothetical protein